MNNSSTKFTIEGFQDDELKISINTFELQVSPDQFDIKFGKVYDAPGKNAEGDKLVKGTPGKEVRKWNFSFIIDNTGVLPQMPSGCSSVGSSIISSIERLKSITVDINDESHSKPFVRAIWSDLKIDGTATSISFQYTYFNAKGEPLRSKVSVEITETPKENPNLRSPDISRMPTIKDGDNLVKFCEDYYNDKYFYLKIADLNNLSSFRALEKGKRLEFPPIKK
jgi:hypothetical protein